MTAVAPARPHPKDSDDLLTSVRYWCGDKDADRVAALVEAGERVTAAFRAHGKAHGIVDDARTRQECEAAMLALDAALVACGETA